jgi:hypothetical protein
MQRYGTTQLANKQKHYVANLDVIRVLCCFLRLHRRPGHILTGRNADYRNVANLQNTLMADRNQDICLEVTATEIQKSESNL